MAVSAASISPGLHHGRVFDHAFIFGLAALALGVGALVSVQPGVFWTLVVLDLWLLGYHHVVATYTRLVFDLESLREHRFLVFALPFGVVAGVAGLLAAGGAALLATTFLYWQWFHYVRQSEGIAKAYLGRARGASAGDARLARAAFWAVPVAGILHVSARDPSNFLGMPIWVLPVPAAVLPVVDALAIAAVAAWGWQQFQAWRGGRLAPRYASFVLSHWAVFGAGYLFIETLNHGWLVVNIWHNAQYILFVWLFNNRRYGGAVVPGKAFLSTISRDGRFPLYIAVCLTLSTAVYFCIQSFGVGALAAGLGVPAAVAGIAVYQSLNFHHYIVDSVIWKLRKRSVAATLGVH